MRELDIYDSQGSAVEGTGSNARVQDFFFDGVRLAIDVGGNSLKVICFFRARDSSASRSEQYYAVFKSGSQSDLERFPGLLEERVEKELGLILESSTDDTKVFELLHEGTSPSAPLREQDAADLKQLLSSGQTVKLGAGRYVDALGILYEFGREGSANRLAIAENADSSHLTSYDLVIEKGTYSGAEFISDTEAAVEDLRERRRKALDPSYGESDDASRQWLLDGLVAAVMAVGVVLVVIGVFGVCAIGSHVPFADAVPGVNCGESGFEVEVHDVDWPTDDTASISGRLYNATGNYSGEADLNVSVSLGHESNRSGDGSETATSSGNQTWNVIGENRVSNVSVDNGTFDANVTPSNWTNLTTRPEEPYRVTVEFRGAQGNWTPDTSPGDETSTSESAPQETETATPTESDTPETTESPSPEPTEPPSTTDTDSTTETGTESPTTTENSSQSIALPARIVP